MRSSVAASVKTVLLGSLLGGFILLGCDSTTGSGSTTTGVAGTWKGIVRDSVLTMVFLDSTFTGKLHDQAGKWEMFGTYRATATTVQLLYMSSLQDSIGAPPPSPNPAIGTLAGKQMKIPAPYDFSGSNDSVTLTKQ